MLLAVPVPEEHAAAGQQIEEAVQAAVAEARYTSRPAIIRFQPNGPLILKRLNKLYFLRSVWLCGSAQGITGRDVTPFILQRVNRLTEGRSLQASILLREVIHLELGTEGDH